MATTTKGIPYPLGADNNDSALAFLNLVNWIDDILGAKTTAQIAAISGAAKWAGRVVMDSDKGQLMFCDGTTWHCASDPVGSICWLGATSTPDGYLLCDGTAVSRTGVNAKLFAKISTAFGVGDGSTTFNLPNLKGRQIVGFDAAQAEFNVVGETGGVKTITLTTNELPSHTHSTPNHVHTGNTDGVSDHTHTTPQADGFAGGLDTLGASASAGLSVTLPATGPAGAHSHPFTTASGGGGTSGPTGTGAAFSILTPYITLQPYIKF
jgi:microcystin-dependent protein